MNKKLLTTIFVAIVFSFTQSFVFAQSKTLDKGQRYFSKKNYKSAIPFLYEYTRNNKDLIVQRNLLHCYIQTQLIDSALVLAKHLVNLEEAEDVDLLAYADLLKKEHNYKEAQKWYSRYIELKPTDEIVKQHIKACKLINEIKNDTLYIAKSININTKQTDYATSLYKDGLILVSSRPNKYSRRINKQNDDHYFNLYFSNKINKTYSTPQILSKSLSSKYHEGSASFSSNEKFIYFSRNKGIVDLNGEARLHIYISRLNKNKWDKPERFQYASDNYSTGHPSISKDGKLLFFISNMPGGYGGTDIYYCRKQGFSWGTPINLGPKINTSGNEMFPYISIDNNLYFSSTGHIGLGGLDIFKTIFEQNKWTYPVNIGYPFNSDKDDFAYIFDKKKQMGYFSSNRDGNDDIFEFTSNPAKLKNINGHIAKLRPNVPIDSVSVFLVDNNTVIDRTYTNNSGNFKFNIFDDIKYSFIVQKDGFKTKRVLYFPQKSTRKRLIRVRLQESPWANIKVFVKNQFSTKPINDAKVEVVNKTYKISNFYKTDANGNFTLSIDNGNFYDLIVSKSGYFTIMLKNYKPNEIQSIDLIKTSGNQFVELNTSTYPNQGWLLKEATKEELNNIIETLGHNPDVLIEVRASTQIDLGGKSNKEICLKRATEAVNYLITQGIPANRIKAKAVGYNSRNASVVVKFVDSF